MSKAVLGTFEDLLDMTPEALRPLPIALRDRIMQIHPGTCLTVRPGDRAATFGVGPRKMKEGYAYIMPHKAWVNLGFYQGAFLPDPSGLLEGTGARLRHIKLRSLTDCANPDLHALIRAAVAERHAAQSA